MKQIFLLLLVLALSVDVGYAAEPPATEPMSNHPAVVLDRGMKIGFACMALVVIALFAVVMIVSKQTRNIVRSLRSDCKRLQDSLGGEIDQMNNKVWQLEQSQRAQKRDVPDDLSGTRGYGHSSYGSMEIVRAQSDEDMLSLPGNKLYAELIYNGYLNRMSDTPTADTVYEVTKFDDRRAEFTVYHGAYGRVVARPSSVDGCEQNAQNPSPSSISVERGEAQFDGDKWRVTVKPIVKFI